MRNVVVWIGLLCCIFSVKAQNYNDAKSLTFFGIDYSLVKLYGVAEEPYQYKVIFREMNGLFRADPKKYDLKKAFGKDDITIRLENTTERNNAIDPGTLKILNKEYKVTDQQIKELIETFPTGEATGYGAVMLATLMDRSKSRVHYNIVVFDIETKEIIRNKAIEAKAAGNTFQDYWAMTVQNALKAANK